jgi:hypothetical protein
MIPTPIGSAPEDTVSELARWGGNSSGFPELFFSRHDKRKLHWRNEPDDGEAISLALMAVEKLSDLKESLLGTTKLTEDVVLLTGEAEKSIVARIVGKTSAGAASQKFTLPKGKKRWNFNITRNAFGQIATFEVEEM